MANDLISRKALVKALIAERDKHPGEVDGEHRRYNQAVRAGIHKALRAAEEAPAVDPAPVVHGRWILKTCWDTDGALNVTAECSEGCEVIREIWRGYFIDVPEHIAERTALSKAKMAHLSNYCPDCGAKMDLEE